LDNLATEGLGSIEYGPGKLRTMNSVASFDWEGWAVPLVTHHDYIVDFDWHIDFQQLAMRWAEPFLLTNPVVDPGVFVPSDAQFSGAEDFKPVINESVLLSFAYVDYRYRFHVDVPGFPDMPWYDKLSDQCQGSNCSGVHSILGPLRGEITRHDDFGTTFVDRRDDSLVTTGFGGMWNVAINLWSGVNTSTQCVAAGERPAPTNTSLTVNALQCSPYMCDSGTPLPLRAAMRWSNVLLWQEMSLEDAVNNDTAATLARGTIPVAGDAVEIPPGFHVLFDFDYNDTNVLEKIVVYGKLEFLDGADRELHVRAIVNFGEVQIGSPETPFAHRAEIVLHGNRTSNTVVVSDQHFLGNKMIANFGNISMVGARTDHVHVKLAATVAINATSLSLITPVDWAVNDTLVLSGTAYQPAPHTSNTGTYTGFRFVTLTGPDELATQSEEITVTAISSDGQTISFTPPLMYRHFAGEIDTGLDYEQVSVTVSGQPNAVLGVRAVSQAGPNVSWAGLLGTSITELSTSLACSSSGWPTATIAAVTGKIVLVQANAGCVAQQTSAVVLAHGAVGLLVVDGGSIVRLYDNTCAVPTMIIDTASGTALTTHLSNGRSVAVHPYGTSVDLRASVGNMARKIVVRGHVEAACNLTAHASIFLHYVQHCLANGDSFFECAERHETAHECHWMKGYGGHILTGEWNYGSADAFRLNPDSHQNNSRLGQMRVAGVEFRDLGKLATEHRAFVINYWNTYTTEDVNNSITVRGSTCC
jgi:hypothetical protein